MFVCLFQRAIATDSGYALAYYNAGIVYLMKRQLAQARDYFQKAVLASGDAQDDSMLANLGVTKVRSGPLSFFN